MKQIDASAKIYEPVNIADDINNNIVVGPKCSIGQFSVIRPRNLVMEYGAEICFCAVLAGGGNIHLGKYSTVDYGAKLIPATFTTNGLYMNDVMMEEHPENVEVIRGSITLMEGAVIGSNAVVCVSKHCRDIVIGEHSVVGSQSYLDRSVPDNTIIHPTYLHRGFGELDGFTVKERRRQC